MNYQNEIISGTCQQLLFSPKGVFEGAPLKFNGAVVQIVVDPSIGTELLRDKGPGKRGRVLATAEHSPKAKDAAHPVYLFQSFADAGGMPIERTEPGHSTLKGIVAALHYARHGEPDGVILEGGEFIHLRPKGMPRLGLKVGSKATAVGEIRSKVLGTRMMDAQQVNRAKVV